LPTTVEIYEAIEKQMQIFFEPGEVRELRALKSIDGFKGTASGYFDNVSDFAKQAANLDGQFQGIYFTINPVKPSLLARAQNRIRKKTDLTTGDKNIAHRAWILIDIDPIRETGISSTTEQLKWAVELAYKILDGLQQLIKIDFTYIVASSGNGAHLLIKVNLPNDPAHAELVCRFLRYLGLRYNTDKLDVDQKVFNAARICKVYGTTARKGDSTEDRPHRRAKLLKVHEGITLTTVQISEIADLVPKEDDYLQDNLFDLKGFMDKFGINAKNKIQKPGETIYHIDCPWNPEHRDDAFIGQKDNGMLFAGCFHNSCQGKQWHDLRLFYEPKAYDSNGASGNGNGKTKKNFWIPIARRFCQKYQPFTCNGILYIYKDGYYSSKSNHIKTEIHRALGEKTCLHTMAEIEGFIKRHRTLYIENLNPHGNSLLNLENGMFDWQTNELKPHDPTYLSTIRIPIQYDPEAECPAIEAFLQKLLPNLIDFVSGELPLVYEIFGTTLTSNIDVKTKALMCYGFPGTGKSQFLALLLKFVGKQNSCSLSLKQLAEDKFMKAQLFGKLLNAADDISNQLIMDTEDFKKTINPTQMQGQHKFQNPFFFTPFCTHVFSCNELPTPKDKTGGFWDRWIIVRFIVRIRDTEEQVQNYAEKIATPEELSGLLNKSIKGLQRVASNGFSITQDVRDALEAYREQSDPTVSFIKEMCVLLPHAKVPKIQLYNLYRDWCESSNLKFYSKPRFYKHIKDCFPGVKDVRVSILEKGRCRAFKGIGLQDEYHQDEPADEDFTDDDQPRYDDNVLPF